MSKMIRRIYFQAIGLDRCPCVCSRLQPNPLWSQLNRVIVLVLRLMMKRNLNAHSLNRTVEVIIVHPVTDPIQVYLELVNELMHACG